MQTRHRCHCRDKLGYRSVIGGSAFGSEVRFSGIRRDSLWRPESCCKGDGTLHAGPPRNEKKAPRILSASPWVASCSPTRQEVRGLTAQGPRKNLHSRRQRWRSHYNPLIALVQESFRLYFTPFYLIRLSFFSSARLYTHWEIHKHAHVAALARPLFGSDLCSGICRALRRALSSLGSPGFLQRQRYRE